MGLNDEVIGSESVADVQEGLGDGNATCILGKVYKKKWNKNGVDKSAIMADLFIVNFTSTSGGGAKMLDTKREGNQIVGLDFPKTAKGEYITFGQPLRIMFMEPNETSSQGAINMFKIKRRDFAKKFPGALVDDKINWGVIQKSAGVLISVDLAKDGKYVNADIDSISIYNHDPVKQELLVKLYETLDAEIARRKAAKSAAVEAPPEAVPVPEDELPF